MPRPTPSGSSYTVKSGDIDETIARRLGVSVRALRSANPDVNWNRLKPGQKLRVPSNGTTQQTARNSRTGSSTSAQQPRMQTVSSNPQIRSNRVTIARTDVIVREEPTTESDRVTLVDQGRTALILDRKNGWFKLRFDGGTVGWVRGDMLVQASAKQPEPQLTAQNNKPRTNKVANPRTGAQTPSRNADPSELPATPDTSEKVVITPSKGNANTTVTEPDVTKLPTQPAQKVASIPNSSRTGSQAERDVVVARTSAKATQAAKKEAEKPVVARTSKASPKVAGLLDDARDQMGIRYVWGGTSRSGFDCSGFTQWVFARNGIRIPRTSIEQATVGQRIDRDDLRPGDLVFFRTRGNRISHVGIYIGNNNFIHASSGGGRVRINAITGYYSQRYVTARRMPGLGGAISDTAKSAEKDDAMDELKAKASQVEDRPRAIGTTTTTAIGN